MDNQQIIQNPLDAQRNDSTENLEEEIEEIIHKEITSNNYNRDDFINFIRSKNPEISFASITKEQINSLVKIFLEHSSVNKKEEKEEKDYIKTFNCQKIEKSILNDKEIISIIRNPHDGSKGIFESKFIMYEIYTELFNWTVNRRYSDFIWLRECLRMLYPAELVPKLPGKKLGNRRFEEDYINKRMRSLQNFLNLVLQNENFKSCAPLIAFISIGDRATFEEKMNEMVPSPFPSVEELMNFDGKMKLIDFENKNYEFKESFYKNVQTYFSLQNESLKELNRNLKQYDAAMGEAKICLDNVKEIFQQISNLNTQAKIVNIFFKFFSLIK